MAAFVGEKNLDHPPRRQKMGDLKEKVDENYVRESGGWKGGGWRRYRESLKATLVVTWRNEVAKRRDNFLSEEAD